MTYAIRSLLSLFCWVFGCEPLHFEDSHRRLVHELDRLSAEIRNAA